jgi:hypothetical protein
MKNLRTFCAKFLRTTKYFKASGMGGGPKNKIKMDFMLL